MTDLYRCGNHNPRNIYKHSFEADWDMHIGVMFKPSDGRMVAEALNLADKARSEPAPDLNTVHQYMVRAFLPDQRGKVTTGDAEPYRTFYAFAPNEQEAARVFHRRNPHAVIRDLWQLMPPGYLGGHVFTPDRDDRDVCATPATVNACKVNERVDR